MADNLSTQNTGELKGFTRYIIKSDFISEMDKIDSRFNKIETTFHGEDGRNGIVSDIHILKTEWRTAKNMLNWVVGGSLLTFIVGVLNLMKMFGVI